MIENDNLTTGNSFNYEYFRIHYKLIVIDLSKQKSDFKNQQIHFIGRLEEDATIFFIIEEKHHWIRIFTKFFAYCIKMELQKIINLLDYKDEDNPKFQTKKWYVINDQNNGQYGKGDENEPTIKFSTEVVKPFLVDYSDAYVLVTGDIKVVDGGDNTHVAFKNCHLFTSAVIKLNDQQVGSALYLDLTMNLYNLIEYSDNYADTAASFIIIKDQNSLETTIML